MMKEYIDELNKYLPDNCKVCYSLRYKSGSKYAFGVIGVCKGYDAKVQHIDLIDNFADLEQDEQMTAISKAYEILSPFIFVDVNERIEELYPNASKRTKEMYKKRHARQVAEMTLLMPTSSRIKRTIKKIRKGEVVETAKTKKPRKPTKKQKAKAKEHSRNKTLAVKVRNHLKDGLTPKEIIIVMNVEEAKLKGVLAGMSRGTYGDVNQNFMRRRKVYKMFRKGWTDEKIYKHCNWLDPKTLQLAGFKAGYKRLCNKNGVDFKFPKKMASAPVKKAKKDTPVEEATVEEAGKWKLNDNASSRIFTDEDNRVIRQQLDKDSSIAFIAYFIGKNYQTVWSHIKKNFTKQEKPSTECVTPVPAEEHILVWDRHENKRKNGQQIVNLRNQGKSNKEVADELDMGYSTVCAFVQHHCSKVLRSDMIKELEASTVKKKKKQKKEDKAIYQPMKPRMIVVKGKRVKEPMYDGIRIAAMINEGKKPKEVAKILKISLNNLLFFTQYHIIFVTVNKTNNEEQGETK
jgi:DNA-binding CsgD family transcriptional regulator